ncbi:Membrane-bound dolichyl-phosphate-mannose-protein mannosyltransferase [Thermococcus sp. 4557]|uniref:glycosyltransferase family 39 protein n=1 Tax=Thermococcus sp. (strain CGMCC 1.5172 / 4557) TaxID=1042877 RepID=UPI000219EE5A|nr:glycosyltransferase family 39 protein [Thermococcus sp. 4557]AEK72424.1 Membrane-bound dolichyl-phosphate-mannose-protein mannosyltransferase [Thermococcus sp. 4557]
MNRKYYLPAILMILAGYIVLRTMSISQMNEYIDYDEGTYLLIARLINQGYLPYRDIFAVHPPLYYYILALWLRVFGDSYIVGRMLSVVAGGVSIALAYKIGSELRDEKLGTLFALALVLDPTILRVNRLVLHDTFVELFVISSMYYFVRYKKTRLIKYAYLSLALAGIGSAIKFTIIPYIVALYIVFVLMLLGEKSWEYIESGLRTVLSSSQILVVMALYLLLAAAFVSLRMAWPSWFTEKILVLLGVHPFSLVGHKYVGGLIVVAWAFLTIYVFSCRYVGKLVHITRETMGHLKPAAYLLLSLLIPKAVVELLLGYGVSTDYLNQTYLLQSSRYFSFAALFQLSSSVINTFYSGVQERASVFVPMFFLTAVILVLLLRRNQLKRDSAVSLLFLLNFVMYLLLFPIIPNLRFLIPLILVFYLFALDVIMSAGSMVNFRNLMVFGTVFLLLMSMTDYGLLINAPHGNLELPMSIHSKSLRDGADAYLKSHPCNVAYSINPMNAYYLDLNVPPWFVDSFGLLYMAEYPSDQLVEELKKIGVDCIVLGTWMDKISDRNSDLNTLYSPIKSFALVNGTPIFSGSYSNGDLILVSRIDYPARMLTPESGEGKLWLLDGIHEAFEVYPIVSNQSFNFSMVLERLEGDSFLVRWYNEDGAYVAATAVANASGFIISLKNDTAQLVVTFSGIAIDDNGNLPNPDTREDALNIYVGTEKFRMVGKELHYTSRGRVLVRGKLLEITKVTRSVRS